MVKSSLTYVLLYPPQQSCSRVYWFHHVRPSVCRNGGLIRGVACSFWGGLFSSILLVHLKYGLIRRMAFSERVTVVLNNGQSKYCNSPPFIKPSLPFCNAIVPLLQSHPSYNTVTPSNNATLPLFSKPPLMRPPFQNTHCRREGMVL
jgi:hypothetical protein